MEFERFQKIEDLAGKRELERFQRGKNGFQRLKARWFAQHYPEAPSGKRGRPNVLFALVEKREAREGEGE